MSFLVPGKYELPIDSSNTGIEIETLSYVRPFDSLTVHEQVTVTGNGAGNFGGIDNNGNLFTALNDVCVKLSAYLDAAVSPIWIEPSTGRMRASVDGGNGTIAVSGNLSFVTSLNNLLALGGFDAKQTALFINDDADWQLSVRARIN
jgi:hypothetical protein